MNKNNITINNSEDYLELGDIVTGLVGLLVGSVISALFLLIYFWSQGVIK